MSESIEWESVPGEDDESVRIDREDTEPDGDDAAEAEPETAADPAAAFEDASVADYDFEDRIPTGRWGAALSVGLVAGAAGLLAGNPTLVSSAAVGMAYAAYGYATRPPALDVALDRTVSDDAPLPGERVTVSVTVENVGDRTLPDLRVIDDVPGEFELLEGTPGFSTTLEPGDDADYEYVVRVRRGDYVLGPTVVVSRNVSGSEERRRELANELELSVQAGPRSVPLQERTIPHTGRIDTDQGGDGLEFHSTRQYHTGDPMNRIDWNRYASTSELTTVNYREEQTAVVVVMVDVRSAVAVRPSPQEPDAVELGSYAGQRLVDSLLDHNDRVGVGLYGDGAYLSPSLGRAQSLRAKRLLEDGQNAAENDPHVVTTYRRTDVDFFRKHMRPETQVVLVSPLVDDDPVSAVTRLEAYGHPVTVLTPDVTAPDTPGSTVSRVERANRIHDLRESSVRVLEWSPDEPLYTTIARAQRRWST